MAEKRFLVTDTTGRMEMFYKNELKLLALFDEFDDMTIEDYDEDVFIEYESNVPIEAEMLDLDQVPF